MAEVLIVFILCQCVYALFCFFFFFTPKNPYVLTT